MTIHNLIEWQQTFDYKILKIIKFLAQNANAAPNLRGLEECVKAICFFQHWSQIFEIAAVKILLMTISITFKKVLLLHSLTF